MRILIDTNIILDYLIKRIPFEENAKQIMEMCKSKEIEGCIAAHSIPNIFYITRKIYSLTERKQLLIDICRLFFIEGIDKTKLLVALKNEIFTDFEDCLQMECAKSFHADYIVTRNVKDFLGDDIPAIEPEEFLEIMKLNIK